MLTIQRRSTPVLALVAAMVSALVTALPSSPAVAQDGTALRTITADVPSCSVSTGIAFDGEVLYLSCWDTNDLYVIDPADGARLGTIAVSGTSGIGALAWDASRDAMWACSVGLEDVHLITVDTATTATSASVFAPTGGCIDGLAFDGGDETLFTSGDVAPTIYHYTTDGELLDSRDVSSSLGACGSSGIAIGGGDLFLANNGCSQIYRVENDQAATPTLFADYPARLEDLECDDVTFRDQGAAVIWTKDAYDGILNAFELNIGDCGFGGLPPSPDFVMVAFGDSYQSGEGAGTFVQPTAAYLQAYENGSNYLDRPGGQEDTYTSRVSADGNSCHRALRNYAKINRDLYEPEAQPLLIDVTCSGAQIEPAGKPAIVGPVSGNSITVDPASQLRQALAALDELGLTAADVDLVTVGMGGNDAGFGSIVGTCILPSLLRKLLNAYPDKPAKFSLAQTILERTNNLNCANAEALLGALQDDFPGLDAPITALGGLQRPAQRELLDVFGEARMMQVNYPNPLPDVDDAPSYCGGLGDADIGFVTDKIRAINGQIEGAIDAVGGRLELVDLERALGPRALCPAEGETTYSIGFEEANVDDEIDRLLNIDGNGDAEARRLVDDLVDDLNDVANCFLIDKLPRKSCDVDAAVARLQVSGGAAFDYLSEELEPTILPNVIAPGTNEAPGIVFDRSRGLFHPSADGFEVIACNLRAAYADASAGGCLANPDKVFDTVDGSPFGLDPIIAAILEAIDAVVAGFAGNSPVIITYYSEEIEIDRVVTDASGALEVSVTLPDAGPGVHRLQFQGVAANGAEVVKEVRFQIPGDPIPGKDFGVYVCCFETEDGSRDVVDVSVFGLSTTMITDAQGGMLVEIPVPAGYSGGSLDVTATSTTTGTTIVQDVTEPFVAVDALRLAGEDRFATAVAISQSSFSDDASADAVVLARGDEFADALAGLPFAASVGAPLLLTRSDELLPVVAAEIQRVLADGGKVYLLGGKIALQSQVALAVEDLGFEALRIAGETRYDTAVAVAEQAAAPEVVFVARALAFPDALAAGAAAASVGGVVVLTPDDAPIEVTTDYLAANAGARQVAVGGPAARAYPDLESLAGEDRSATAVAVAEAFFDAPNEVGLARSDTFADALTGGLHIGRLDGPILLTPTTELAAATSAWLCAHGEVTRVLTIYGGKVAVDGGTVRAAIDRMDGTGC